MESRKWMRRHREEVKKKIEGGGDLIGEGRGVKISY